MIATSSRAQNRRGLTLVEMLVVVALTVLMMTIIAQIFQATTGAIQIARAYQEIEQDLRAVEGTIKRDLAGVTARMTPPLNPDDKLGYFEYGENEFADAQGEDSDDYLAFTTTYTDGNLFYGRYLPKPLGFINMPANSGEMVVDARGAQAPVSPVTITSDTAEVVYFLRNGNLYRRVFLVKPGLHLNHEYAFAAQGAGGLYEGVTVNNMPGISNMNTRVGWQALNDISMRPAENVELPAYNPLRGRLPNPGEMVFDTYYNDGTSVVKWESEVRPIANDLKSLTNRQNRAFKPRFSSDYYTANLAGSLVAIFPDGVENPDDFYGANQTDGSGTFRNYVNDYQSTTYPNILLKPTVQSYVVNNLPIPQYLALNNESYDLVAPKRMPVPNPYENGAYDANSAYDVLAFPFIYPNAYSRTANNLMPDLNNLPPQGVIHGIGFEYPDRKIQEWNHNPLDEGDNLNVPILYKPASPSVNNNINQTWWGFPTWREQLSPLWIDPLKRVNANLNISLSVPYPLKRGMQAFGLSWNPQNMQYGWLPAMDEFYRTKPQLFKEGDDLPVGTPPPIQSGANSIFAMPSIWNTTWEDDLIATNVRSFDVKVFEPLPEIQSYVDLGYLATVTGGLSIRPPLGTAVPFAPGQTTTFTNWLQGFGHEGRMPPLTSDYRLDALYPFIPGIGPRYVGDDDPGVVRLRRVWDTWSTDYAAVDAKTLDPLTAPPFQPAPRPSYPAPYPAPLRGIQIQIRMTDPRQERVRTITIHQDFTTKL